MRSFAKGVVMIEPVMKKIKKVTIEYDDCILTVEGEEAEMWQRVADYSSALLYTHGEGDERWEINWKVFKNENNP